MGKGITTKGLFMIEISANDVAPALVIHKSDLSMKLIKFFSKLKISFSILCLYYKNSLTFLYFVYLVC